LPYPTAPAHAKLSHCAIAPAGAARKRRTQDNVRVIGLTGGIGTGKSEAARVLAELGAVVIDADAEGHRAYAKGSIGWRRLVEIFSSGILNDDQEIDRAKLGQLVFANPQALAWLNAAIHPLIRQQVSKAIEQHRENGEHAVVIDAALLYQAKWDDLADEVWVVSASPATVLERLQKRGLSPEDVRRRADSQSGAESALRSADAIIENDGAPEDLRARVQGLWEERILSVR